MTLDHEYDVLSLTNPLDTPEVLDLFQPDLIILDVMMPKISGFQLADYLKKNEHYKNIPVVFLSAKGTTKDQKYGYSLGASLYLTKPFEPNRLIKNVRLMLNGGQIAPTVKHLSMLEVNQRLAEKVSCRISAETFVSDGSPEISSGSDNSWLH